MFISSSISADEVAGLSVAAAREVVVVVVVLVLTAVLAIGYVAACLL
jgi:hypothetical protein